MRISDWSSDVCSSDLRAADDRWLGAVSLTGADGTPVGEPGGLFATAASLGSRFPNGALVAADEDAPGGSTYQLVSMADVATALGVAPGNAPAQASLKPRFHVIRSEEHTSELPSLMRISDAVLCLQHNTNQAVTKYTH